MFPTFAAEPTRQAYLVYLQGLTAISPTLTSPEHPGVG